MPGDADSQVVTVQASVMVLKRRLEQFRREAPEVRRRRRSGGTWPDEEVRAAHRRDYSAAPPPAWSGASSSVLQRCARVR